MSYFSPLFSTRPPIDEKTLELEQDEKYRFGWQFSYFGFNDFNKILPKAEAAIMTQIPKITLLRHGDKLFWVVLKL